MNIEMAPLEGITNFIYRQAHARHFGKVDRYYTPFISPTQHESLQTKEWNELLPEHNEGLTVVPQILTKNSDHFLWAASQAARLGYPEVNLNLGCPSGTVVAKGKGAGMLRDPEALDAFLDSLFRSCPTQVSIKTRIGVTDPEEFHRIMQIFNQYPLIRLIIHPRVQKEFYKGDIHLDTFQIAYEEAKMPLVYNGNLFSLQDIQDITTRFPNVEGIMLGRGLLASPLLAEQVRQASGVEPLVAATLASFHQELLRENQKILAGEKQLLFRIKELWPYWAFLFPEGDHYLKKIRKSKTLSEYTEAVSLLLSQPNLLQPTPFVQY